MDEHLTGRRQRLPGERGVVDSIAAISTSLAAVAAALAAISALASWRSTKAVEEGVRLQRGLAGHQLVRSFELDYSKQYGQLVEALGPWEDEKRVDPQLRRAVHDACQTLASIYVAEGLGLLQREQAEYVFEIFGSWLRLPEAAAVWRDVFRPQTDSWPPGFVSYLDENLAVVARTV